MKVNFGTNTVTLERGDVVEVMLPSGDSVWVWASGRTLKKTAEKRPRRKPVNNPDPYDPATDDGTVFHDGLDLPSYGS
jgi:hypothetical protein